MPPTRLFLHIVLAVFCFACGQDEPKPVEAPPAAAATQPATPEPVQEPAPAPTAAAPSPEPEAAHAADEAKAQPSAAKPAPGAHAVCVQVCDRTEKLNCGPIEQCMAACAAANDGTICGAEMSAFMSCALKHPAEHWECTDEGVAAIKDSYCDSEQQAVMTCFEKTAG